MEQKVVAILPKEELAKEMEIRQKRIDAFIQASYTAVYMLVIWFPMVLFICGKILFCKKDMNWGKTTHGLVMEEEAGHQNINNLEKELQNT